MEVLIILIIVSICTAVVFLIGFLWSVKSGQYNDLDSPSVRMLMNDSVPSKEKNNQHP